MTHLLYDVIKSTEESRIVSVIAPAYNLGEINYAEIEEKSDYKPNDAYAQSKLALFMHSQTLAKMLKGKFYIKGKNSNYPYRSC